MRPLSTWNDKYLNVVNIVSEDSKGALNLFSSQFMKYQKKTFQLLDLFVLK